jgi:6-pyruvoyltetrahydropterin/6-carboxytetrahydropterin synthase
MIYLSRREQFNAAHRLAVPGWSEKQNKAVFGECASPNYHGHNFILYVTVCGDPDPETGMLMNVKTLSNLIKEEVVQKVDHGNLNVDVPFMEGLTPTTENLAKQIWEQLDPHLKGTKARLYSIRLYETENHFVDYFGN